MNRIEIICVVVLTLILGWIASYGRRKGISEARFNSKTEKEIK